MTKILLGIFCFLLIGCFIYFCIRLFLLLLGMTLAISKGNKEAVLARADRQAKLKTMPLDYLRELLRNDMYLNRLKGCRSLAVFWENFENQKERDIVRNSNEKTLYSLLVGAEYETGHKGRPEAGDHVAEIWDILKEIAQRGKR